ncbi:hypothetical protein BGZ92_001818 [Podila epicladia]|nr:hypothetical protein BGZ92_001818 [Podila epicladia]
MTGGLLPDQVFEIVDTDKVRMANIKIKTRKDYSENHVVYWSDLLARKGNVLFLKDKTGSIVKFLKDKSDMM